MARVGVYLGDTDDPVGNIQRVLTAWGDYLADTHELDAFGSAPLPGRAEKYYTHIPTTPRSSRFLFDKVLGAFLDCREYINNRSPDIVMQVWKYKTHGPGIALGGWSCGVPVITRLSGDAFNEYRQVDGPTKYPLFVLTKLFGRVPIQFSQRIITLGPYERNLLQERGASPGDIVLLPPPLDLAHRFTPPPNKAAIRRELDVPLDRRVALYVGRLTKQKGMEFLIDVIDTISQRSDMLFVLVGDGPFREHFSTTYSRSTVRTEGRVPYEEIHKYYQLSDVFVHPSPFEGVPLVLLEALECGTPVVARDIGDNAFVTDNVVDTPDEMVDLLSKSDLQATLNNRSYFAPDYQRTALNNAIDGSLELTDG